MCISTQKLTWCRHFNVLLDYWNTYTYINGENSKIVNLCALCFNQTDVWRLAGVHCMLRIAKIVVIYKNNIEENNNRFSCCSEYTFAYICCHELPRPSTSCCFAQVWGEGRVGNAIPPIFPRQCCVFPVTFATKFSVRYVYLLLPYPLLILKSQLSRLLTCDLIINSQCQD